MILVKLPHGPRRFRMASLLVALGESSFAFALYIDVTTTVSFPVVAAGR